MLCVAEYATNALAVVDARAGEVVGRIPVGRNPASVLVMQGIVFVGCSGTGEVTAVPVANPAAAAPIPVGHQILGLCRDEARGLIYAGDYFVNGVHAIDAALQSLVSTMDLSSSGFSGRTDPPPCCTIEPGAGRRTVALALAPEGDVLYAANYGTYDVVVSILRRARSSMPSTAWWVRGRFLCRPMAASSFWPAWAVRASSR
ncbi:MAG: YncE family protein [Adlercreutzia sp.]